ncbi:MAG: hypothetical protein U0T82_02915 [Bacteroidales bacterium]
MEKTSVSVSDGLQGRQYSWSVPEGASILTQADSNGLCKLGSYSWRHIRQLIISCDTFDVKMPVTVVKPELSGPMFLGKKPETWVFSLPYLENTVWL